MPLSQVEKRWRPVLRRAIAALRRTGVVNLIAALRAALAPAEKEAFLDCLNADRHRFLGYSDSSYGPAKVAERQASLVRHLAEAARENPGLRVADAFKSAARATSKRPKSKMFGIKKFPRTRTRKKHVDSLAVRTAVRDFLMKHSSPSGNIGKRRIQGQKRGEFVRVRSLHRSIRKLWQSERAMQKLLGRSLFYEHVKKYHSEFRRFKKKVDVCSFCHKYDKLVLPNVRSVVVSAQRALVDLETDYFAELHYIWDGLVAADQADPDGKQSLQYVEALIRFIRRQNAIRGATLADGPGDFARRARLHETEHNVASDLEKQADVLRACEHHFMSVKRQHCQRENMLHNVSPHAVDVQLDFKENDTMPVGPSEEGTWFWGTSREQVNTLGIFLSWRDSQGRRRENYYHYVSAIMDKTALFAAECLRDCIERAGFNHALWTDLNVWADCGPHFRCYLFVWAIGRILSRGLRTTPSTPLASH